MVSRIYCRIAYSLELFVLLGHCYACLLDNGVATVHYCMHATCSFSFEVILLLIDNYAIML